MNSIKQTLTVIILAVLGLTSTGCQNKTQESCQGYIEGDFVNIASSQSGRVDKIFVKKGERVAKDALLFTLESDAEIAAVNQAKSELQNMTATFENMQKGSRKEELSVIEAKLSQALINAKNMQTQFERNKELYKANAISQTEFDNSMSAAKSSAALVEELQNSIKVSKLPTREDLIKAQQARVKQSEYALKQAAWKVDEKTMKAPKESLVFDVLYREGEFAGAGGVVVRLLPPSNVKIRFFAPLQTAQKLKLNQKIFFSVNQKEKPLTATTTYISAEAEYTPPLIYSAESKNRLVFMVEAAPDAQSSGSLRPGQPVKVTFDAK